MPIIIILTLVIDAFFIYHAIRTGRPYWWAFVILSFPVMGCVVYYLIEIFPNSREHRSARKAVGDVARALRPNAELKKRVQELEICGSVENKALLAEECISAGMFEEAARLYANCLNGVYANDPTLMFGLARAHFHQNELSKAKVILEQLIEDSPAFKPDTVKVLRARTLEGLGDTDAALREYETLIPGFVGLEAKCRYAALLKTQGYSQQAEGLFNEVVTHAKRFRLNEGSEGEWLKFAKRSLER